MEFDVARTEGLIRDVIGFRTAWNCSSRVQPTVVTVKMELSYHVHAKIRHIRDSVSFLVNNYCVSMRIPHALLLCTLVVIRVVHMAFRSLFHCFPVGIDFVHGAQCVRKHPCVRLEFEDSYRGVPVVDQKHMLSFAIYCEVACTSSTRIYIRHFRKFPCRRMDGPRGHNAIFLHRLRASVKQVLRWMDPQKSGIFNIIASGGDRNQRQLSGEGIDGVCPQAEFSLFPLGPVGKIVEPAV